MPTAVEVLQSWEWNEALADGLTILHEGLVSLLAFSPDGAPKPIGTGFIVASHGSHAVAVTAAHNFHLGVKQAQASEPQYNLSALSEFLPDFDAIKLDRKNIRAIYRVGKRVEACVLGFAVWDKHSDLAVFTLAAQNVTDGDLFQSFVRLGVIQPKAGDVVCVAGYGDMDTVSDVRDGDRRQFAVRSRLVMRAGRVKAVHAEGHILCRAPCIETTIPVFGGMSGGPAFLLPENIGDNILPFGLISSDPDEPNEIKNDRSHAGSSIIAMLPVKIANVTGVSQEVLLNLANIGLAKNPEFQIEDEATPSVPFDLEEGKGSETA